MVAVAVRIRVCTGLLMSLAANPSSCRTTERVCVSLTLRDNSLIAPPLRWVSRMASPGLRKSTLCRIPGRLRMAALNLFGDVRLHVEHPCQSVGIVLRP